MQIKTKFKKTPIGEIPDDWAVVRLGEVITLKNGARPMTMEIGQYPVYGANGIMGYVPKYLIDQDFTIIIGRVGASGEVHLASGKIWVSDNAIYSEKYDVKKVYPPYLFYLLKYKRLSKFASKTTHPLITQTFLKSFKIPLPPLPEQKKIAEILRTVDEAIEKTDLAIEKTERVKKGLMQRLLTRGIKHERFKKTEIGEIPEEWRVARLEEGTEFFQYGLSIKMYDTGKYPIIKMDSIINGEVKPVNIRYVDLDDDTFKKYRLEKGDILINRTNSYELVGRTGVFMLDGDYVFASYLIRIRPDKKQIDSRFLTFYLVFAKDKLRQLATRAVSQANINASNLKKFKIPLPSLSEQKQIAEILMTVDKKLELLRKRKEKLERIKKGLMKDLLTGRRRVNV